VYAILLLFGLIKGSVMSKQIIFLDIDGVLYDFLLAFWDELVWFHGYSESQYNDFMNDPNKYIFTNIGRQLLETPIIYERIKANPGDVKAVDVLSKQFEIKYVTSRPENCFLATKHWLKRERFPEAEIIIAKDKGKLAEELKPAFAVEDTIHHIEAMSPFTTVFVIDHNYNQSYQTKTRIRSVQELI
jgi:5'(3')-deoxyribonucleotidase